jgi:hypothetical protein
MNVISNNTSEAKIIPIQISTESGRPYILEVKGIETFNPALKVYLRDNKLQSYTLLDTDYKLKISTDELSTVKNRFDIVLKSDFIEEAPAKTLDRNNIVRIYPNPSGDGNIKIEMSAFENTSVQIIDMVGKVVIKSKQITSSITEFNTCLDAGMYNIIIQNNGIYSAYKWIIKNKKEDFDLIIVDIYYIYEKINRVFSTNL